MQQRELHEGMARRQAIAKGKKTGKRREQIGQSPAKGVPRQSRAEKG